jgi:large subunit ribosomal protein L25
MNCEPQLPKRSEPIFQRTNRGGRGLSGLQAVVARKMGGKRYFGLASGRRIAILGRSKFLTQFPLLNPLGARTMSDTLQVEKREKLGTIASRRLRDTGMVPVVLYGHGEPSAHFAVSARELKMAVRHHSRTINLAGAVNETALLADIQYDALGIEILHLDLIRVNLQEKVEVTVAIHLKGDSVGVRSGGILLENTHQVQIRCPAGAIPDSLDLDVTALDLGDHISASEIKLPPDVELITSGDTVIAHVEKPKGTDALTDGIGAQPEVIAKGSPKAAGA